MSSHKNLSDPKEPIFNCLSCMSTQLVVHKDYNDDQLLLDAHELLHMAVAPKCQQKFVEVLDKLRMRNKRLNANVEAWDRAARELRNAIVLIDQLKQTVTDQTAQIAELQKMIAAGIEPATTLPRTERSAN